jgi:hypothetical protein
MKIRNLVILFAGCSMHSVPSTPYDALEILKTTQLASGTRLLHVRNALLNPLEEPDRIIKMTMVNGELKTIDPPSITRLMELYYAPNLNRFTSAIFITVYLKSKLTEYREFFNSAQSSNELLHAHKDPIVVKAMEELGDTEDVPKKKISVYSKEYIFMLEAKYYHALAATLRKDKDSSSVILAIAYQIAVCCACNAMSTQRPISTASLIKDTKKEIIESMRFVYSLRHEGKEALEERQT